MPPRPSSEMPFEFAEAAFRLFSKNGIRRVSVDAVAAAAGVTKGSLYWHFRSKQELIHAACAHYYRMYHQRLMAEIADSGDPVETIERVLKLNVKACLLDRENRTFTLEILALSQVDASIRKSWLQFYDQVRTQYVKLLVAASDGGTNAAHEATQLANSLLEAF